MTVSFLIPLLMHVILAFTPLPAQNVVNAREKEIIMDLLQKNGLKENSLRFHKDWSSSTRFKMERIQQILADPMTYPVFVDSLIAVIGRPGSTDIISYLRKDIFLDSLAGCNKEDDILFSDRFEAIKKPRQLFSFLESKWQEIDSLFRSAWYRLDSVEMKKLHYFSLTAHQEEEDSLKYRNFMRGNQISEYDLLEIDDFLEILVKIDVKCYLRASSSFLDLCKLLGDYLVERPWQYNKRMEKETPWGKFCIGTDGTDIYDGKFAFIYDPGGDDIYNCPISTDAEYPYFCVIDREGNDCYKNSEIGGLISVFAGIGFFADLQGNDIYQGDDFALSASWGTLAFHDEEGDDYYSCGLHSLGAATFGIAVHTDLEGDDVYCTTELGEGFGSTLGAGILADYGGDDVYIAGRKYLHVPLAPLDYRSLAQGFGFGMRPDLAGGIGVLYDACGNDSYKGAVYAQGVAYWYALGILIDREGNDFYDAVYYPQGSGIHLAGGFLFDEQGEDHYYSKHGPGQGAAHDYGVGFLVDRSGNDCYSVEGGNGLGLTNSVGIFLDVSGNDQYQRNLTSNYGYASTGRESGSIGIFLDTGGDDSYALEHCSNDSTWISGTFGMGLDMPLVTDREIVQEIAAERASTVDSLAEISTIFKIASEWGVGTSAARVEIAGLILLKRDAETAEYIAANEMDTKDGLVYRAISNYAKQSVCFPDYLAGLLQNEDSLVVRNTIGIIGEIGTTDHMTELQQFLKDNKYITTVLSALGNISADSSAEILACYRFSPVEKIRFTAARGLRKINSELSRKYLLEMKEDDSFLVRTLLYLYDMESGQ
ncbi:MAG: HEAT repeat domain-containing protein [Candidatus Cloacimonetes bacterium]|nr:HEAT repeat domain-containing protein [Candidatus Cloacimonadota bacterium]